jgi:NTE family protein
VADDDAGDLLASLEGEVRDLGGRPVPARPAARAVAPFAGVPEQPPPRVGLVLAGGGAKGGYQVGAVRRLAEAGIEVDALAGTSIGALNAAVLAGHDDLRTGADALVRVWRDVGAKVVPPTGAAAATVVDPQQLDRARSLLQGLAGPVVRAEFLEDLVRRHVHRFRRPTWAAAFPALERHLGNWHSAWLLDKVNALSGQRCAWLPLHDRPIEVARTSVLASAALPLVLPPRRVDGRLYRDGGYDADNLPAGALLAHTTADPIVVIHLSTGDLWDHTAIAGRRVLEIRPTRPLTPPRQTLAGLVDFSPARFEALHRLGYDDADAVLSRWLRHSGTFHRLRTATRRAVDAVAALDDD